MMRDGVVADWDALIPALQRRFAFAATVADPSSLFSRRWRLTLGAERLELEVMVHSSVADARDQIRPSNFGGVAARDPLGDAMVEVGDTQLIWTYRNVIVFLSGAPLRPVGEAVQQFLVEHRVAELVRPEVALVEPLPARVARGTELVLPLRIVSAGELVCDGGTLRGGALIITATHVGVLRLYVTFRDRRTLLAAPPIEGVIEVRASMSDEPRSTRSRLLPDHALVRGVVVPRAVDRHAHRVLVIPLAERTLLVYTQTLVHSAAPPALVTAVMSVVLDTAELPAKRFQLAIDLANRAPGQLVIDGVDWIVTPESA